MWGLHFKNRGSRKPALGTRVGGLSPAHLRRDWALYRADRAFTPCGLLQGHLQEWVRTSMMAPWCARRICGCSPKWHFPVSHPYPVLSTTPNIWLTESCSPNTWGAAGMHSMWRDRSKQQGLGGYFPCSFCPGIPHTLLHASCTWLGSRSYRNEPTCPALPHSIPQHNCWCHIHCRAACLNQTGLRWPATISSSGTGRILGPAPSCPGGRPWAGLWFPQSSWYDLAGSVPGIMGGGYPLSISASVLPFVQIPSRPVLPPMYPGRGTGMPAELQCIFWVKITCFSNHRTQIPITLLLSPASFLNNMN